MGRLNERWSETSSAVSNVSWSPDSRHFFVNDASGSTDTLCYVCDPQTLRAVDVLSS